MYAKPAQVKLTDDLARELDNTFFSSDPFGYFTARISNLLAALEGANQQADGASPGGSGESRFDQLVGPVGERYRIATARAMKLQLTIDAFALRHHAAETLLRFAEVLLRRRGDRGSASVWADIAEAPVRTADVLASIRAELADQETRWAEFRDLVFPAGPGEGPDDENTTLGVDTFVGWFNFALDLLGRPGSLDATAAHNKFKHGLAVRVRDDLLITFSLDGPDADGNIPLSALQGDRAVDVLRDVVLEFISRPQLRRKQGLESTIMRLDPVRLLAQAALMSHTYSAMFTVAAHRHFGDREGSPEPAAFPGLLIGGPLPEHVEDRHGLVALRYPLTLRPDGGAPRPAAILYVDGTTQAFTQTAPTTSGQVICG